MVCPFKKVVVVGATSGIGLAMAQRLAKEGAYVIVTGRRQARLDEFVAAHGGASVNFDISNVDDIPAFAQKILKDHPDIDCVLLNAGVQYRHEIKRPETIDISKIKEEINVNYVAYVALCQAFLPHLIASGKETTLAITSSGLALVPLPHISNYSASKAALHTFLICLKDQLKNTKVNVVEIYPPLVQTELHDQQKKEAGREGEKWGMPLEAYTEEGYKGLVQKAQDWPVAPFKAFYDAFEVKRLESFRELCAKIGPIVGF